MKAVRSSASTLRVTNLSKAYGEVVVADRIDLHLESGTCTGVIGPNGAGKTSLFNLLDGTVRPDAGQIFLNDIEITRVNRHQRARLGITRAFQVPQPFPAMTVYENVLVAATFGADLSEREADRQAVDTIELTGLADLAAVPAGSLRLLDRKRLELAKSLASSPQILLLDEIAGGLTEPEVAVLVALVNTLKSHLTVVWIEHIVHALLATANTVVVLDFGRKIAEGSPTDIMSSAEVKRIYMGIDVDAAQN